MRTLALVSFALSLNLHGQERSKKEHPCETWLDGEGREFHISPELEPEYPGGVLNFLRDVSERTTYDCRNTIDGRTIVRFSVLKNGEMRDFEIFKNRTNCTDKKVLDALKGLDTTWTPAKCYSIPVDVKVVLPISFKSH